MQNYILICEIGPIVDFITKSRKTIDLWGSSNIFSSLMWNVAWTIQNNGGEIFRPSMKFTGGFPDQIYAIANEKIRLKLEQALKSEFASNLQKSATLAFGARGRHASSHLSELKDYFYLFYIWHPIKDRKPSYQEYLAAENKVKGRGAVRNFNQLPERNSPLKWNKCSLCGDRDKVHSIKDRTAISPAAADENLCSVCLLKRFSRECLKPFIPEDALPRYESTSDIALSPVKNFLSGKGEWDEVNGLLQEETRRI
jgi:hypothetical protein